MRREFWLIAVVAMLFSLIGLYFGLQNLDEPASTTDTGNYFFTQSLPDVNNNSEKLSKWQGKLLLVNFWATWCAPCVEEMPELSELQQKQDFKNLQVIGIGIDSAANIREFAAKHHITYPLYVAGMAGTELSKQMGNQQGGLPFTLLITPDGQVKKTYLGRLNMDAVRKDLASFSS
jgi:thiol-disulfide isomerase/thioredoxin